MTDDLLRQEIAELRVELERIQRRLERAERALSPGSPATPKPEPPAVEPPPIIETPTTPTAPTQPVEPPPIPAAPPGSLASQLEGKRRLPTGSTKPPPTALPSAPPTAPPTAPAPAAEPPPVIAPPPSVPPRRAAKKKPRTSTPVEMVIGGKITAWVGSIVVVAAIALLIHLGITSGWWGNMPAAVRCLLIAGFGGLLIGGAEIALRKISRPASVGLFAAGLGVLYLDAFASFEVFGVIGREWSFALMAIVAAVGFAITLRTRFRTIGVLSLIGGYLTPILLRGGSGQELGVATFLTGLFAVALGLSAVQPKHFRSLRYVALGGQMAIGLVWMLAAGSRNWSMIVIFISVWWTMVLAEAVFAALRKTSRRGNAIAVLLATAAYVTAGSWVLDGWAPTGPDWLGLFTIAIAGLSIGAAMHFGPGLDALRGRLVTPMDTLSVALWAQAGVLLTVAIAQQFDGFGEAVSWLAVGLGCIEIGRRLPSRGVDVFGLIVGALALVRIALLDSWFAGGLSTVRVEIFGAPITDWTILALIAAVAVHVAAHRFRAEPGSRWRFMPPLLAVVGTLVYMAVAARQAPGMTMTGAWLLAAIGLVALHRFAVRERYLEIAMAVLFATGARWLLADAIAARLDPAWSPQALTPVLNPQMGLALAIAATGAWAAWCLRRRTRDAPATVTTTGAAPIVGPGLGWALALLAGTILTLIGVSFEIDRTVESLATGGVAWAVGHVRQVLFTLTWGLGAIGIALLGRMIEPVGSGSLGGALLRRVAWILLAACVVKWIIGDTLYWAMVGDPDGARALMRLVNVQMITGLVLAGGAFVLRFVAPIDGAPQSLSNAIAGWAPVAACVLVLWGLSFEIDRFIARLPEAPERMDGRVLRYLWWIGLWSVGGAGMTWASIRPTRTQLRETGWIILAVAAVAWLTVGTLLPRVSMGRLDVLVILNLQFGIGVLLIALLASSMIALRTAGARPIVSRDALIGFGLIALIGLWLGSLEIDRLPGASAMARQAGLSVYWALYAVLLVIIGFIRASAWARYAGLSLLAITVLKVLLVDLATVERTWRVVSFLVSGLLLIGTSMLYWRLGSVLLPNQLSDEDEPMP